MRVPFTTGLGTGSHSEPSELGGSSTNSAPSDISSLTDTGMIGTTFTQLHGYSVISSSEPVD